MARTTLNIHKMVFARISAASVRLNRSKKQIIVLLLKRLMEEHSDFRGGLSTVKYQSRDVKENWHSFCIRFREDDSEFFSDLRKLCKFSVSCLLAIAADKYLGEILENGHHGIYNYVHFTNYVILHETVEGFYSWRIYWGYPEETIRRVVPAITHTVH